MGISYSNPKTDKCDSLLDELYGKSSNENTQLVNEYRREAKRIMTELSKRDDASPSEFDTLSLSNIFVNRFGKTMPYDGANSNHPIFQVDNSLTSDLVSPEKIRYLEIVMCQDNGSKATEKYAVHNETPDHDCGPNCHCIERTFEIQGNYSREISSPQHGGMIYLSSPTSTADASDSLGDVSSSTSTFESDTSEDLKIKVTMNGGARKTKRNNNSDDVDSDLDLDEEGGIMLEHSSISTSDLYRMQSRIFGSNTPTENNEQSEAGYTEEVERALNVINRKKQTFNSEERNIMDMSSDSKKLLRKKPNTNSKYT